MLSFFPSFSYHDLWYQPSFYGNWSSTCVLSLSKRCKFIPLKETKKKKKSFASRPGACLLGVAPFGAQRPPPPPACGLRRPSLPWGGAEGPPGGVGAGAAPLPAPAPRTRQSHYRAGAAAGGIEDRGLRRPPRVCPAPAPAAAAVPNLRYSCKLASCPGAPALRANRRSAALHPKCGI